MKMLCTLYEVESPSISPVLYHITKLIISSLLAFNLGSTLPTVEMRKRLLLRGSVKGCEAILLSVVCQFVRLFDVSAII